MNKKTLLLCLLGAGMMCMPQLADAKVNAHTELAAAPTDTCGNEPVEITPQKVYDAMIAADAIGRYYKGL